ncbi:hypothetical protein LTR37_003997 [Vermiconidia calcicola]|uniref:Uncharacterized protein n=1 Tax=Vermiconidia calcicola TaxID=1690605 RepID=A0ACC3NNF8_9PEZI|nr:hypothetical protein LTR37_003997 [Vermiconidia calcicola]
MAKKRKTRAVNLTSLSLPSTSRPTLSDRFNNLPPELRLHIFSLLLVQPVKWQIPHHLDCPLISTNGSLFPTLDPLGAPMRSQLRDQNNLPAVDRRTCIRCVRSMPAQLVPLWRRNQWPERETWVNPWRSQWACGVRNEFMCSDCWDGHFRAQCVEDGVGGAWHGPKLEGKKKHLRCLCARRRDLGVLMVCRKWYEEAGRVFWTRNTFAFEDAATFTDFVSHIPVQRQEMITKVSLIAHHETWFEPSASAEEQIYAFELSTRLQPIWSHLRLLTSLSYLEFDALFLTRTQTVHSMLRLGLPNLRRVCFTIRNPRHSYAGLMFGTPYIYPEFFNPLLLIGGLAEEVARGIKGQRRSWLKRAGAADRAVEREKRMLVKLTAERGARGNGGWGEEFVDELYYEEDFEEWRRLWWREVAGGGGRQLHHAYLPSTLRPQRSSVAHWRERRAGRAVGPTAHECGTRLVSADAEDERGLLRIEPDVFGFGTEPSRTAVAGEEEDDDDEWMAIDPFD